MSTLDSVFYLKLKLSSTMCLVMTGAKVFWYRDVNIKNFDAIWKNVLTPHIDELHIVD